VPSITTKDFFLGATITVYSRQLKVVEYGDAHTERAFASARQRVFALVKPNAIRSAGKIIHAAVASGFVVAECKMATMQRADAERMFGDRNDRALVNDACAGACVGIALVSEDAVAKFAALNGEKARSYLHRSPYDRVGVVNADP
jgi:nucleoside-diphosphate kinase